MNLKNQIKMKYFLCILLLFSINIFSQHKSNKSSSHKLEELSLHKSKIITDKQYSQKLDSVNFSSEFFFSNINTWTGDNYNTQPSFQFLLTYDNNKNYNFGFFGCLNYRGLNTNGIFSNGVDLFFCRKFTNKLTVVIDAYTYVNKVDSLENYFNYHSSVYTLYTTRIEYDFNKKHILTGSYYIMNNYINLLNFISLEYDYNFEKYFTATIIYSTGQNIFKLNDGILNVGIGFNGTLIGCMNLGLTIVPFQSGTTMPFLIVLSTKINKRIKKQNFYEY